MIQVNEQHCTGSSSLQHNSTNALLQEGYCTQAHVGHGRDAL